MNLAGTFIHDDAKDQLVSVTVGLIHTVGFYKEILILHSHREYKIH